MAGDYSDIAYVQAHSFGGTRESTQVVVIHATDNTAKAAGEAAYAARRTDSTSCHFFVDDGACIQSVPLSAVAYGCLYHGNHRSVQFELCGVSNKLTDATLRRAAPYVRRVCDRYGIPLRKVSPAEVRAGVKGICGHGDITLAFPEDHGDHTDPGAQFPWSTFIGYVNGTTASTKGHLGMLVLVKAVGNPAVAVGNGFEHRSVSNQQELTWFQDAIRAAGGDGVVREYPTWDAAVRIAGPVDADAPTPTSSVALSDPDRADIAARVTAQLAPAIVPLVTAAVRAGIDGATLSAPAAT